MRFIDEVNISVASGRGGDGNVSFRREKFVAFGGPDGGNGGSGGDVIFKVDRNLNTLLHFRGRREYLAEDGEKGMRRQRDGKAGDTKTLYVPAGTLIKNQETGETIYDLVDEGQEVVIAKGGRGGLGNMNFKTSTNQAPRYAQEGEAGKELDLTLELKLLADIALVGLPNAGKSTLISSISAAKPKIADYPFTTLEPNLGVVPMGKNQSFVVADIPGLIEDASEGKGLGTKFLKHIDRTSSFVHIVDVSWCLDEFEAFESYTTIRNELQKYNPEMLNKREIICLSKIDAMTEEEIEKFKTFFEKTLDKKVLPISSVSGRNIDNLKNLMWKACELDKLDQNQMEQ